VPSAANAQTGAPIAVQPSLVVPVVAVARPLAAEA